MWPFTKDETPAVDSEADKALARGQKQLEAARALRVQAGLVHVAAAESLARNNYGASLTAAMTGRMKP